MVLRDSARLAEIGWGLVVADEAQHAKNPLSRTARELRALPAPARIALTGTPVENRLIELWSILDWTTPGLLGQLEAFTRRVAVPVERYRDPEATARFAALVRPFLLRRRKTDPGIAPELPPKTETDRIVPLTAEQVTLYEAVVRETMAAIEHSRGHRAGRAGAQAADRAEADLQPPGAVPEAARAAGRAFGQAGRVRRAGRRHPREGESMLVFTQYAQMATLLQQHLDGRGIRLAVPARRRAGAPPGGDGGASSRPATCRCSCCRSRRAAPG